MNPENLKVWGSGGDVAGQLWELQSVDRILETCRGWASVALVGDGVGANSDTLTSERVGGFYVSHSTYVEGLLFSCPLVCRG